MTCFSKRMARFGAVAGLGLVLNLISLRIYAAESVVISEIMYHPVEESAFNADGTPALDLSEDVHEYVELHNYGAVPVALGDWKLTGGIAYTFPQGTEIRPGEFLVVAKNKTRLAMVSVYGLNETNLFGPYEGNLSNRGETVRLRNAQDETVDAVSYSAGFPWPISADGLGAGEDWTGLKHLDYQYRGRSLERVSFTASGNDPANWLASPLPGEPSPGKPNAVYRAQPLPVVIQASLYQAGDEQPLIRNNQPARLDVVFSATAELGAVVLEYFVDNINAVNEPISSVAMTAVGEPVNAKFTVLLPGQPDRSVVRYRLRAERAGHAEVVSPRPDDPFAWHAYFVTPVRSSANPNYDLFISSASLNTLSTNISQNPHRVTSPDPPGYPRVSWDDTEPAIFVCAGVVRDIQVRYHGSRYNRSAGKQSYKFFFPRFNPFNNQHTLLVTEKGNDNVAAYGIFRAAGLPASVTRWVDLYVNGNGRLPRLELEDFNDEMLERYHQEQFLFNPGQPLEKPGEFYKSMGVIDPPRGEGPYGRGDGSLLPAISPYWTPLQRYEWTYPIQDHDWKGGTYFRDMIEALWRARGDTASRPNPNLAALRTYFLEHFDIDKMLTYHVVLNWMVPWDDTTQNHFFWQQTNGKWTMLPWDMDAMFGDSGASIFAGEVGDRSNNFRGPNFFKDSFIKAFRQELKERNLLLVNTLLHPDTLTALGYGAYRSFASARLTSVVQQCGLGTFQRPNKPVNLSPPNGISALPPAELRASSYSHSSAPAPAHASTTWEIRSAQGSYSAPIFKTNSLDQRVSLPIPFVRLRFGETYFWRCTYWDASGHPSLGSDETSFTFGGASHSQTNVVRLVNLDATSPWRYNQTATNLNTAWRESGYDDSAWPTGAPLLALETAALPEPIRTPLNLGKLTYYFRHRFNVSGNPHGTTLQLRHVLDDGAVIYLNGTEILRVRMPEGAVTYSTLASQNVGDAVYEGPVEVPAASLVAGDNVLAVEVHQSNPNSSDIVFGLSLEAITVTTTGQDLVINEIMANHPDAGPDGRPQSDWIELFNNADQTQNLAGYSLSDEVAQPDKFVFPPDAAIPAHGFLTIWCDQTTNAPGLHTGFGLKAAGQTVVLARPAANGLTVQDALQYGLQVAGASVGRIPDGSGDWQLTQSTPNAPNRAETLGDPAQLKVNEWMANPASGNDWLELFNPQTLPVALGGLCLTDNSPVSPDKRIAPLSFVGGGGFVRFVADEKPDQGADHANFKLKSSGDSITLCSSNGVAIDRIMFGAQSLGISQGRLPDGTPAIVSFPSTATPGDSNYRLLTNAVINEVLSHSDPPLEDAIELFNPTAAPVDLSGWYLSDEKSWLKKYRLPESTVLAGQGFLVLYEYQFNADTNSAASFALSSARGDEVILSEATSTGNLTGYRTSVKFGAGEKGVSFGRYPTSVGIDFVALSRRTFGEDSATTRDQFRLGQGLTNAYPTVGPVVISEIMYHPPDLLIGTNATDNLEAEFIELFNASPDPVKLFDAAHPTNTWQLQGAVEYAFPSGVVLPPNSCLVVVSFDPLIATNALARFRAQYPLGIGVLTLGPYRGHLGHNSEQIELYKPDEPGQTGTAEAGFVPLILVERIRYSDQAPWPSAADGTGASLQRLGPLAYGNDPINWIAASPTPGRPGLEVEIEASQVINGAFVLQFQPPVNCHGTVEYSDSLAVNQWQVLTEFKAEPQVRKVTVTNTLPVELPQRFYRLRLAGD